MTTCDKQGKKPPRRANNKINTHRNRWEQYYGGGRIINTVVKKSFLSAVLLYRHRGQWTPNLYHFWSYFSLSILLRLSVPSSKFYTLVIPMCCLLGCVRPCRAAIAIALQFVTRNYYTLYILSPPKDNEWTI